MPAFEKIKQADFKNEFHKIFEGRACFFGNMTIMSAEFVNLIDLNDYPVSFWNEIVELGHSIKSNPLAYAEKCKGKNADVFPDCNDKARRFDYRI